MKPFNTSNIVEKIYYNKLVRDKIPENIRAKGSECETFELSDDEFENELLKKIKEETSELVEAQSRDELISEIADLLDVVEEIKKLKGISDNEINKQQKINFEKKGGFFKKLFLVWSSNDDYKKSGK